MAIVKILMDEGFGQANLKVVDQYVSERFIEHQFGAKNGRDGLKQLISQLYNGVSDLKYNLVRSVEDGDVVWAHFRATAVHSKPFMGIPPTGKTFVLDVMDVFRIEGGLIVEHWGVPDRFAVMQQIGMFERKEKVS